MKADRPAAMVAITALVLMAIAFYSQHREAIQLRARLLSVTDQLQRSEAARLKAEERALNSAATVERLESGISELPRLRGDVAMLRVEVAEKSAALTELKDQMGAGAKEKDEPKPPINAFGTEVRDFGAATPERAATSLIWAATSGEKQRFSELLELPPGVPDTEAAAQYDHFANMLSNNFSRFQFTEIKSVRPNPDGTLRLGIMYRDPESGNTNPFPFIMRQHETGWKVVVEGDVPKKM